MTGLRIEGVRELVCMVKSGGIISAQRCVEQQVAGCYCPGAPSAIEGTAAALEEPGHVRDEPAAQADAAHRAKGRAQLVELRARAAGFARQPPEKQFAGLAKSVQDDRVARARRAEQAKEVDEQRRPLSNRPRCSTAGCRLFAVKDGLCGPDAAAKEAKDRRRPLPPEEKVQPPVVRVKTVAEKVDETLANFERMWACPKCGRRRRGSAKWKHPGYDDGKTEICGTCRHSLDQAAGPVTTADTGALRARIATLEAELADAQGKLKAASDIESLADVLRGICLMVLDRLKEKP